MGFKGIEELLPRSESPLNNMRTNIEKVGYVYLIREKSNNSNIRDISIIIDIFGTSDDLNLSGLIVNIISGNNNALHRNGTTLSIQQWISSKQQIEIIATQHLNNSKYLTDPALIPSYVIKYWVIISISVLFFSIDLLRSSHSHLLSLDKLQIHVYRSVYDRR